MCGPRRGVISKRVTEEGQSVSKLVKRTIGVQSLRVVAVRSY
jgi:hypothetical protein